MSRSELLSAARHHAFPGRPFFSVNIDECLYKSHTYVNEVNEHFFEVVRGNRFYLKLDLYDLPGPLNRYYDVTLLRNKTGELQGVASTALIYDIDSVDIQIASQQHQDSYLITASTSEWEVSLRFTLNVVEAQPKYNKNSKRKVIDPVQGCSSKSH